MGTVPVFKIFCQYWQKFNYVYVCPVGAMMVKKQLLFFLLFLWFIVNKRRVCPWCSHPVPPCVQTPVVSDEQVLHLFTTPQLRWSQHAEFLARSFLLCIEPSSQQSGQFVTDLAFSKPCFVPGCSTGTAVARSAQVKCSARGEGVSDDTVVPMKAAALAQLQLQRFLTDAVC